MRRKQTSTASLRNMLTRTVSPWKLRKIDTKTDHKKRQADNNEFIRFQMVICMNTGGEFPELLKVSRSYSRPQRAKNILQMFFANQLKKMFIGTANHSLRGFLTFQCWYNFMKKQACPLFVNNHRTLSHLQLIILNEDLSS